MVLKNLRDEIDATLRRDPAARSRLEVVLCYPGFQAVLIHRLAHFLWQRDWLLLGRFISHCGRVWTGIEIHPGARIGRRFFIDHGMGVVIGETAEIGDDVTLYQGVTLGGTALHRTKRHPTIGDGVIVGSGAQILGGFTVGAGARVGANAVVLGPIPPGVTVVGVPARPVGAAQRSEARAVDGSDDEFCPYGMPSGEIPDPVARALGGLLDEVASLRARLAAIESRTGDRLPATDGADMTPAVHDTESAGRRATERRQ